MDSPSQSASDNSNERHISKRGVYAIYAYTFFFSRDATPHNENKNK